MDIDIKILREYWDKKNRRVRRARTKPNSGCDKCPAALMCMSGYVLIKRCLACGAKLVIRAVIDPGHSSTVARYHDAYIIVPPEIQCWAAMELVSTCPKCDVLSRYRKKEDE